MRYITTNEAANILGVTTGYIRRLLLDKKLKGKKHGRDWLVNRKSVDKYASLDRSPGRRPLDK